MKTTIMTMVALGAALLLPSVTDRVAWSMGERVPVVGTTAADFTLTDLDGQTQSLRQYRGKIVLGNFWATWCKPCTTEMPAMQACYDKLRDQGFVVLAVNEWEVEAKGHEAIHASNLPFPCRMDPAHRWTT